MVNILWKKNTAGIFVYILLVAGTFTLSGVPIPNLVRGQTNTNSNDTSEIQAATLQAEQQQKQKEELKEQQPAQEQQQRPNHPPRANAGSDKKIQEGANVILDARRSSDPDGDQVTYLWRQTSGPRVTIENTTATVASFVAPDVNRDSTLEFTLTVRDERGAQDTDIVKVSVNNVETRMVTSGNNNGNNNNNNNIRSGQTNTNTNTKSDQEAGTTATNGTNGLDNTTTTALLNAQSALRNNGSRITPPTTINPNNNNQLSASTVFTPQAVIPFARVATTDNIVKTKGFYDVIFRTGSSGPIKSIEVVFPPTFTVTCCLPFLNEVAGIGPGLLSAPNAQTLLYTVTTPSGQADVPVIPSGTTIRLEYANIVNPTAPDNNLAVTITTKDSNGGTIDGPTSSSAFQVKQIGTTDIADNAVTTTKIQDGQVATTDLAGSAVTTTKIQDGQVATTDLAGSAVTGAKILDFTITSADIAPGTFSGGVADNSVTSAKIIDGEVGTVDLAASAITADKIATDAVTADKLAGVSKLSFHNCNRDYGVVGANQIFQDICVVFGAEIGDTVIVTNNPSGGQAAFLDVISATVFGDDQVQLFFMNNADIDFDPATLTVGILLFRP